MAIATWWRTDPLPLLQSLPGFHAGRAHDDVTLARLNRISSHEVLARRQRGHQPYIGYLSGVPVAYGWVATRQATIGELDLTVSLPRPHRYLWDFATLPEWQGRGIYPRLLQAILKQEPHTAECFWIIYAPENLPSSAGMRKAGFVPVAELSYDAQRKVRLAPLGTVERAQVAADLFGVALVDDRLAPCWVCQAGGAAACWPPSGSAVECTCAVTLQDSRPAAAVSGAGAL